MSLTIHPFPAKSEGLDIYEWIQSNLYETTRQETNVLHPYGHIVDSILHFTKLTHFSLSIVMWNVSIMHDNVHYMSGLTVFYTKKNIFLGNILILMLTFSRYPRFLGFLKPLYLIYKRLKTFVRHLKRVIQFT